MTTRTFTNIGDRLEYEIADAATKLATAHNNPIWSRQLRADIDRRGDELAAHRATMERAKREDADRKTAQAQAQADAETARRDALELQLRSRFKRTFPGGDDHDFQAMRPKLLADIASEKQAANQRAAASYSFLPEGAIMIED